MIGRQQWLLKLQDDVNFSQRTGSADGRQTTPLTARQSTTHWQQLVRCVPSDPIGGLPRTESSRRPAFRAVDNGGDGRRRR
jgi:hypothetical protein